MTNRDWKKKSRGLDEREKIRKFRELDDAFALALQDLDKNKRNVEVAEESSFQEEVNALIGQYSFSHELVLEMLKTLMRFQLIK